MYNKKIIFVLGMHRSGTSALASTIESIGISLGNKTKNCDYDNPYGYFENEDFVTFNEEILSHFSARWDNPFFDCKAALQSSSESEIDKWIKKATKLLKKNLTGLSILAVKDPRNSILLPFWEMVLETNDIPNNNIFYVCMLRHPIEVANSQILRYTKKPDIHLIGESTEEVFVLWFYYYFHLLKNTKINKILIINYKNLLDSPDFEIDRLCKFVDYKAKLTTQHKINKSLYRNKSNNSDITLRPVKEMYELLNSLSEVPCVDIDAIKKKIDSKFSFKDSISINRQFSKYIYRLINKITLQKNDFQTLESHALNQNIQINDLNMQIEFLSDQLKFEKNKNTALCSKLATNKNNTRHLASSVEDLVQKLNIKHSNEITLLKSYLKVLLKEWAELYKSFSIYGAGQHTIWLLGIFEEVGLSPITIYDDDPKVESIKKTPVLPFSKINKLTTEAIIISSDTYHQTMKNKLVKNYPELTILDPYEDMTITPFEKN